MTVSQSNIILLSADALRADHLSCYGYDRKTSPYLDSLYTESLAFSNAFSVSSHTREAIPSLLTGEYPNRAVDDSYHLSVPTIASQLSEAGYKTGGFHSNPYVSRAFDFNRGFDKFYDDLYLGQNRFLALAQRAFDLLLDRHYTRADKINKLSLSWVDSLNPDESFFLWNHYMDTHGPYQPPTGYDRFNNKNFEKEFNPKKLYKTAVNDPDSIGDAERTYLLNSYDGEIRYLDHQIGEFLEALSERDKLEDSMVIFTSDHGDAFGEQGYYGHPRLLHDELLHVPLMVREPGGEIDVVSEAVSTLDIVPTINRAVGLNENALPGEDLFTFARNDLCESTRPIYSSVRGEGDESSIRRFSMRKKDLTSFAEYDPGEDTLSVHGDNISEKEFRKFVSERISGTYSDKSDKGNIDSGAVEDRLSALGYK